MTAYLVFDALESGRLKLDQTVVISDKAWRTEGSRMFVKVNSQVAVNDLLQGVIVQSGNDASVALAEAVAGSEDAFAALMNEEAAKLGLTATHFKNSTGLPDPEHLTSVRDLGVLSAALVARFPQYLHYYSQKEYTYNNIKQPNRNRLLWLDNTVDGLKTGHTHSAGSGRSSRGTQGGRSSGSRGAPQPPVTRRRPPARRSPNAFARPSRHSSSSPRSRSPSRSSSVSRRAPRGAASRCVHRLLGEVDAPVVHREPLLRVEVVPHERAARAADHHLADLGGAQPVDVHVGEAVIRQLPASAPMK